MSEGAKLDTNKPKNVSLNNFYPFQKKKKKKIMFLRNSNKGFQFPKATSVNLCFCCFCFQYLGSSIWLLTDCQLACGLSQTAQFREDQQKANEFSSPSSSASLAMETQSSAPPPQPPPKDSLAQCYKFLWLMLLAVNVAVGSPFPFLIPQLCDLFFTSPVFIYVCGCLFLIQSD